MCIEPAAGLNRAQQPFYIGFFFLLEAEQTEEELQEEIHKVRAFCRPLGTESDSLVLTCCHLVLIGFFYWQLD